MELHIPPVLSTYLKQRMDDLPQRAHPNRIHQHRKHIAVVDSRLLYQTLPMPQPGKAGNTWPL